MLSVGSRSDLRMYDVERGCVRYKDAMPSSVDRRVRRRGVAVVAARKLALSMGQSYDVPPEKRGRKKSEWKHGRKVVRA